MTSRNVEAFRKADEAFNRQDAAGAWGPFAQDCTFTDQATGLTLKGLDELKDWLNGWFQAFPDMTSDEGGYLDAGDSVIHQTIARGTNSGPLGEMPATGRTVAVPYCEIWHFDADGRGIGGSLYYDQLSMLQQLGHAPGP